MEWNDEVIAQLRGLWDEGHSTAEIGRRLGVSKNAIVGKAHRLSLPPRPSPIRRATGDSPRPASTRRVVGSTLPPLPAHDAATPARKAAVPAVSAAQSPSPSPALRQAMAPERRPLPPRAPEPASPLAAVRATPLRSARLICCCWPIGEPGTPSFHFCDVDALAGKPYCHEHAQLAYVKVRDRRDEAA